MPTTPYSYRTLQGGAAGLSVPVPFPFIFRSHVQVFANLSLSAGTFDQLYIAGTDYNWINNGQISMIVSTAGKLLTVIRGTPIDAPLVGWTDGSNIDATDLLIADKQNLYAIQENLDKALISVSISLSTSQQLESQVSTVNQQVTQQNAALLAQVNAANAALLAQVTAQNNSLTAQTAAINNTFLDVQSIALAAADVGDIKYTCALNDPLGWAPAIGATVSRTAFAELFAKIGTTYGNGNGSTTFVAGPDCRGVVLRGLDLSRGLDPNRAKGSYQNDQNKAASLALNIPYRRVTPSSGSGNVASDLEGTGAVAGYSIAIPGGDEARMKNVAERAIIKCYSRAIPVNYNSTTTPPPPSTLIFTTAFSLLYVPVPNGTSNPRPVQLSPSGTAMNTGVTPNRRNCIFSGLTCSDSTVTWQPVGQDYNGTCSYNGSPQPIAANAINAQRFDYYFGAGVSSGANTFAWSNAFELIFGSFYLVGPYSICGAANAVAVINAINTGSGQIIATAPNGGTGSQNTITSSTYNIVFGASGITGTLRFTATTNVQQNPLEVLNTGSITITVNQ
jgi:microcystin-dependent protein